MADMNEHLKAFAAAVKDDPSATETFRVAAAELHDQLEAAAPKSRSKAKAKPADEPAEG
jgi:hypothetical protein